MKLILLKPFLVAKTNGGEISMLERLNILRSWGMEIQIHLALPEVSRRSCEEFLRQMKTPLDGESYLVDGLRCQVEFSENFHPTDLSRQAAMEAHFSKILVRESPDLVWAHYTDFFAVTSAMRWKPEYTWVIVTDDEYPRQMELNQFPSIGLAYLSIQTLVAASSFMQKSLRASLPWAHTLRIPNPMGGLRPARVERKPRAWVFVNPTKVKGVDFMIELASSLPQENFLFVGNWVNEMPTNLPLNVSTLPRQEGLEEIFAQAKGLLMPSVWQEAFGRLVLEAMAAGIPVIASDRGALPETVGDGGLSLPLEVEKWNRVLQSDNPFWETLIERGFKRVKSYTEETDLRLSALRRLLLK